MFDFSETHCFSTSKWGDNYPLDDHSNTYVKRKCEYKVIKTLLMFNPLHW